MSPAILVFALVPFAIRGCGCSASCLLAVLESARVCTVGLSVEEPCKGPITADKSAVACAGPSYGFIGFGIRVPCFTAFRVRDPFRGGLCVERAVSAQKCQKQRRRKTQ